MALTRLNLNKFSLNAIKMKSQNDLLSDMMERILQGNCKLEFRKTVNVCSENYYNLTVLSYDQFEDLVSHFSSSPHLQLYLQLYLLERPLVFYLQNYAHGCFTLFGFTDIKVSQIVVPRNFRSSFSKLNEI